MLVLKKNVHKPGHFQYTIHYKGKSLLRPHRGEYITLGQREKHKLKHFLAIIHL